MTTITLSRATVEQALEALYEETAWFGPTPKGAVAIAALRAALAQQAEPVLQTCNCRWDGEVQVQQCTLHEAHVDAIHEWAERAKVAERKLAQQAEPAETFLITGNEFCGAPPAPYATWGDALAGMLDAGKIEGLRISALAQQAWVCPESPDHRYAKPGHCKDCGKPLVLAHGIQE